MNFSGCLEHVLVFVKAYLMLNHQNVLAVISAGVKESKYLIPSWESPEAEDSANKTHNFEYLKAHLCKQLLELVEQKPEELDDVNTDSMFSGALSSALCYINRMKAERVGIVPRIFVLQISPDVSAQYIAIMNCIFSAQKESIAVDACVVSRAESTFLQQAAHLTGGIYLHPARQHGLLQYLLSSFIADRYCRRFLYQPRQSEVDYRASCFCHKKIIDMGYVCSVCLSIFCQFSPVCSTCGTKFALPSLPKAISTKKMLTNK